ncbi:hypothetical protein T10_3785, partial [Trichinella papuae]
LNIYPIINESVMDTVTNMHRTPDYFYILSILLFNHIHFAIMNKSFTLNKFAVDSTTLNAESEWKFWLMQFQDFVQLQELRLWHLKISGKVVQFAYHQLGVSGGVVVDDEHLLTIFEVIFEGDSSADSEAKFAEQRLRTAVGGHRDHVPTLPVHGHGYRPFGQAFGKTKTAASGADAEQHNLQIFRIRHK